MYGMLPSLYRRMYLQPISLHLPKNPSQAYRLSPHRQMGSLGNAPAIFSISLQQAFLSQSCFSASFPSSFSTNSVWKLTMIFGCSTSFASST